MKYLNISNHPFLFFSFIDFKILKNAINTLKSLNSIEIENTFNLLIAGEFYESIRTFYNKVEKTPENPKTKHQFYGKDTYYTNGYKITEEDREFDFYINTSLFIEILVKIRAFQIKKLNISKNNLSRFLLNSEVPLIEIFSKLESANFLEDLNVSEIIPQEKAKVFLPTILNTIKKFCKQDSFKTLRLSGNYLSEYKGSEDIISIFYDSFLEHLDLSNNNLGSSKCLELFKIPNSLKFLNLSNKLIYHQILKITS